MKVLQIDEQGYLDAVTGLSECVRLTFTIFFRSLIEETNWAGLTKDKLNHLAIKL